VNNDLHTTSTGQSIGVRVSQSQGRFHDFNKTKQEKHAIQSSVFIFKFIPAYTQFWIANLNAALFARKKERKMYGIIRFSFQNEWKVSRYPQSQTRRHVPIRPLHVMSLKDSFLFYYCVPRKSEKTSSFKSMPEYSPSSRLLVSALADYATAMRSMFPWYWAPLRPLCLDAFPCFRALINLQTRIRRPRCSSSRATGTPVAPTADSKRNALLSVLFWLFSELFRSPFHKTLPLPLPARFWPSGDFLSQTTLARSFLRETTVPSFFAQLQHGLTVGRPLSQPSHFLYRFIFVRSLQSSPDIVYHGSVLFSVSV